MRADGCRGRVCVSERTCAVCLFTKVMDYFWDLRARTHIWQGRNTH